MEHDSSLNILIVDDDKAVARLTKRQILQRDDTLNCILAHTTDEALNLAKSNSPVVAVVDLSLKSEIGPSSGLGLIEKLLAQDPTLRIIVLTGHATSEFGIQALQKGAASFVTKPSDPDHLYALIKDAILTSSLRRSYQKILISEQKNNTIPGLIARSEAMLPIVEAIHYAADNNLPVLILGETGVGKGLVARAIHRLGQRHARAFVRVQPSFTNPDLLSSELFGHEKGAFTGATAERSGLIEDANHGTLFIDEVAEIPHDTQLLLLETLQEKSLRRIGSSKNINVDFRLISATNIPLKDIKGTNRLRPDFFHRIAYSKIEIPPLRQRKEDIPDLSNFFLEQLQVREKLDVQNFTEPALNMLQNYSWPGNVRELQAVVEVACHRAHFRKKRIVDITEIEFIEEDSGILPGNSFREKIQAFEYRIVTEALEHHAGNQSKAAKSLQMDRTSLRRILNRHHQ